MLAFDLLDIYVVEKYLCGEDNKGLSFKRPLFELKRYEIESPRRTCAEAHLDFGIDFAMISLNRLVASRSLERLVNVV